MPESFDTVVHGAAGGWEVDHLADGSWLATHRIEYNHLDRRQVMLLTSLLAAYHVPARVTGPEGNQTIQGEVTVQTRTSLELTMRQRMYIHMLSDLTLMPFYLVAAAMQEPITPAPIVPTP